MIESREHHRRNEDYLDTRASRFANESLNRHTRGERASVAERLATCLESTGLKPPHAPKNTRAPFGFTPFVTVPGFD